MEFTAETKKLYAEACAFVQHLDDREGGSEAERLPVSAAMRTALTALIVGINQKNWATVSEAFVMFQQIEHENRDSNGKKNPPFFMRDLLRS